MHTITIPWLEEQIALISTQLCEAEGIRDWAAEELSKAKSNLDTAENRVDDIKGCLYGLKEELRFMKM